MVNRLESSFWTALEQRSAQFSARLDLLAKSPAPKDFKFAHERSSEDSEPIDLPNPLRYRTIVN